MKSGDATESYTGLIERKALDGIFDIPKGVTVMIDAGAVCRPPAGAVQRGAESAPAFTCGSDYRSGGAGA